MLSMLSTKPDHPLADAKESRRIISELVGREAASALDEVSAWLESLVVADDLNPALRLDLILRLDEAAYPHSRKLGRDYLNSPRLGRAQEFRLWRANRYFWAQLAHAYERCLAQHEAKVKGSDGLKPLLTQLYARLLHAYSALLKWDQFRYGPIDPEIWAASGKAYLGADQDRMAQKRLPLYPGGAETTAEAEYLKTLLLGASSMDTLLPLEIEIAERLIVHFLPHFVFTAEARPDNVYWVDAGKPLPPTRLAKLPEIAPTLRFFSAGKALEAIGQLRATMQANGEIPAEINLSGHYSARIVLPVLEHLAGYWAPKPPMRSHPRHHVKSRMVVVDGLPPLHSRLAGRLAEDDGEESWIVEDVSQGGMGANVHTGANDWIRIGTLVGMQPEGGSNWLVGVIRRYVRESPTQGSVGIETLSKSPRAIVADSNGLRCDAVLLESSLHVGDEVRVVMPSAAWEENVALLFEFEGRRVRLQPIVMAESGVDFVLGRYGVATIN
jgi:hypothetical protein